MYNIIIIFFLVTTATAHAVADDFAHTHINIAAPPAGDVKQGAISMTSSFMLVAACDDPIEVKLPLPPSTSDLRADAGKKISSSREARLRCCCCAGTSIWGSAMMHTCGMTWWRRRGP